MPKVRTAIVAAAFALVAFAGTLSCERGDGQPQPNAPDASESAPECGAEALAKLEAAYVAEVAAACPKGTPKEECPAWPGIRDKYQAKREEWNRCPSPKQ